MRICMALAAFAMLSCSQAQATADRREDESVRATVSAPSVHRGPVEVEMHNVDLHVTPDITLRVRHLRGRFVPTGGAEVPHLDDKHSYLVAIDSGEIALGMASLNALMTRTLGQGRSNVARMRVSADAEHYLRQQGVLTKGVPLPFDVKATVEATPDGRIRVHAAKVRGFGLPVTPVMKVFGIEMDDLLKVKPGHGITVEGNDLILDPQQLVPPPLIRGKISAVRVTDTEMVQIFGGGDRRRMSPPAISQNYIYWRGHELQFGKLTMTETDLELIDEDPSDPFDFSVDNWNEQLVAGYSKNTSDGGLKSHMPDYNDLKRRAVKN